MRSVDLLLLALAICGVNAQYKVSEKHVINTENEAPQLQDIWGEAWPFQGINTFAHLPYKQCLVDRELTYDIALIGVPFDTATSYRLGARFGPRAIRAASQRQTSFRGYNPRADFNPYTSWAKILDCGDIPVTPMDNYLAFKQMTMAFEELILEHSASAEDSKAPRYVALGGDHSVILPHLRSLHKIYGPINVIHFDAHLDTWKPDKYPSFWLTPQSEINHGSMLWKAFEEGLISTNNLHAGIRTKLSGPADLQDDDAQHWTRISADDIWIDGVQSVIDRILATVPENSPTYISVDIDVLDPGFGSGTGTQEPGGWLPRELLYVLRGIDLLSVVGADIVEVNPDFDHAEITSTNGAQVAYELITSMVKKGPLAFEQKANLERTAVHPVDGLSLLAEDHGLSFELKEKAEKLQQRLEDVEKLKVELEREIAQVKKLRMTVQRQQK
ncbi:Arginase/deacetylase [Metschnikowia bicuspidata var. bicuspidata NRRL YB-4993]|uniref:Arginase/deacetylase n=1 Tax=Metschnikowia bicuspidata var. bicuspidata NRRL YB-4993 TaxID=869754 RepID=A0A1A0H671_9ASCO|nr:Arginase/deacetylase [Metschnikowia bicuspidata var. bicuspidata NRRL YB-4993]OBA19584.1 Arginase/deacetylase [Metschnikowia bicuspidata var. bicuspidata NRRL YB-4993]